MKIEIPLKGGFNSQYDPEEVGSGLTELINIENKKTGKFIKRNPTGGFVRISSRHIVNTIHWLSPSGTRYYIGWEVPSGSTMVHRLLRISDNFTTVETLGVFFDAPDQCNLYNGGEFVRISLGHNLLSNLYQYIKRSLFWGGITTYLNGGYFLDIATPRDIVGEYSIGSSLKEIKDLKANNTLKNVELFLEWTKTLDLSVNTYYYSYSLVWDGTQETLLSDTNLNTKQLSSKNSAIQGTLSFNIDNWNPRVTGINIYRGTTSNKANHKKIITSSLMDVKGSLEHKKINDGSNRFIYYVEEANLTPNALYGTMLRISREDGNADGDATMTVYGNTEDCIWVDEDPHLADHDQMGAIWGQYVPFVGSATNGNALYTGTDIQEEDTRHQYGTDYGRWIVTTDSGPFSTRSQHAGYYTFFGRGIDENNGLGWGQHCYGVEMGRSGNSSSARSYRCTYRMDTHNWNYYDGAGGEGNSGSHTFKYSVMIGIEKSKLDAHTRNEEDYIKVRLGTKVGDHGDCEYNDSFATTVDILSDDYATDSDADGNYINKEKFLSATPQYLQGTWEGSNTISETDDTPAGDGDNLDYLNTAFKIHWINVTGDIEITNHADGEGQVFFIHVQFKNDQPTNAPIFVDNLTIAKTMQVLRVYGGDDVYVSPTMKLDSEDGHQNYSFTTRRKLFGGGVSGGGYWTPYLSTEGVFGHIVFNTKKAFLMDTEGPQGSIWTSGYGDGSEDTSIWAYGLQPLALRGCNFYGSEYEGRNSRLYLDGDAFHPTVPLGPLKWGKDFKVFRIGDVVHIFHTSMNNGSYEIVGMNDVGNDQELSGSDRWLELKKIKGTTSIVTEEVTSAVSRIYASRRMDLSRDYRIEIAKQLPASTIVHYKFWDRGLADGEFHPLATTSSIEVGHKYATDANGRRFVANVNLDPNGVNEVHKDWVVFSEIGQPDVLPISNYINIQDLQGGEIHGIETLLGDIVVFMDNGVFRISVPSADPKRWTVSESIPDIGCSVPDSIIRYDGGVFFAGKDNYYYLTPNFELIPVATSIKDEYKEFYNEKIKAHKDLLYDKIFIKASDARFYVFDLKSFAVNEENWSKWRFERDEGLVDYLYSDLNNAVYISKYKEEGNSTFIKFLRGEFPSKKVGCSLKTGWIPIGGSYKRGGIVRNINLRLDIKDSVQLRLYTDEDSNNVVWSQTIDPSSKDIVSFGVGKRAKNVMFEFFQSPKDSPLELRRLELEID